MEQDGPNGTKVNLGMTLAMLKECIHEHMLRYIKPEAAMLQNYFTECGLRKHKDILDASDRSLSNRDSQSNS